METDLLVRYFHFMAIFALFALLTIEHMLLKGRVETLWFKKILIVDLVYIICMIIAMICGIGLWLWVGKPAGFYSSNWVFHTKISLFMLTLLLSFITTGFLISRRRTAPGGVLVPKSIVWIIRFELLLLCTIPLLAVLMANGVGYIR